MLQHAMRALIQEVDYAAITVEMIIERANVARKTFYAHHASRDELLWATLDALYEEITGSMAELDPDTLLLNGRPLSFPLFVHVQTYARLYRTLLGEAGSTATLMRVWTTIAEVSYSKTPRCAGSPPV